MKKKIGDTVYGIGWLPLGGYVKISGMVDESMDKEQMKKPAEPWEFRSKPAWQRLVIMVGGVTVNIILAFVIYSMMLFTWGKDVLPASSVAKNGVMVSDVMKKYGFKDGDRLISIDGSKPYLFSDYQNGILLDNVKKIEVSRGGKDTLINIPNQLPKDVIASKTRMFNPLVEFIADKFTENSVNKNCGLKKGDKIIGINGRVVPYFQFFAKELLKDSCQEVGLNVLRNKDSLVIDVKVNQDGKIGLYNKQFDSLIVMDKRGYSFFESIPAGFIEMTDNLSNYVKQLKYLFTSEGINQLGGFGSIGSLFPESFTDDDYWQKFWSITALLSVILAIMNLLPIPALDGGHVLFLFYEIIFRRKPGEKFLEYAQITGMVLLLGLMVFANGKDIVNGFSSDDKELRPTCWEETNS